MKADINNIQTPICDFTIDYALSGMSRFHMPGHKGAAPFMKEISSLDITEIKGADSLYEAGGIIAKSEACASSLFGTSATFYSTEGSSQCIRAMLSLVSSFGSGRPDSSSRPIILAARNVHRAFITAAALLDLDVRWVFPPEGFSSLCSCDITAEQIKKELSSMPELPAAVYITSPDYLGNIPDISAIADAAHSFSIPLLVDNAHGAYLHFLDNPAHPMDLGADMCCDSAHKTFPALTGAAYLHISRNARDEYKANARRALAMFGSTSPSYLLLQSLDSLNPVLAGSWRKDLRDCISKVSEIKRILNENGWLNIGDEPLKITIDTAHAGYRGSELAELLRSYYIECEYADPDYLVLMLSPFNSDADLMKLKHIFTNEIHPKEALDNTLSFPCTAITSEMTIREAAFAASCLVPVESSVGYICTDMAISCPPAIPLIICGELIPEEAVPVFRHYGITHISVFDAFS